MVGEPSEAGGFQARLACFADGLAPPLVLVVGRDVADAGMQADRVVVGADDGQLGTQDRGVGDGEQMRVLGFDVAEERLDPRLVGRLSG